MAELFGKTTFLQFFAWQYQHKINIVNRAKFAKSLKDPSLIPALVYKVYYIFLNIFYLLNTH